MYSIALHRSRQRLLFSTLMAYGMGPASTFTSARCPEDADVAELADTDLPSSVLLHLRQVPHVQASTDHYPAWNLQLPQHLSTMALTPSTHADSRVNAARRRRESHEATSDVGDGKRRKVQRACDSCKSRKRKCSGEQPCPLCVSQGLICTYITPHGRHQAAQPTNHLAIDASRYSLGSDSQSQWPGQTVSVTRPGDAFNTNDTSRAASPDGEGITPAGYQGPTSTFSVSLRAPGIHRKITDIVSIVLTEGLAEVWHGRAV